MKKQMTVTDRLRQAIRDCGMSQKEIARRSGVPQPMINRFVNGWDLRGRTIDRLCEFLGLSLEQTRRTPAAARKRSTV